MHRIDSNHCRLVVGHMIYDGGLELGFDVALALRRVFVDGPGIHVLVRPGRKISFEQDGTRLLLRNGEGAKPTVWQTEISLPEFHRWVAQFLYLIDLDEWERDLIPRCRAQLIPLRVQTEWAKGRPSWADAKIGRGKRAKSVWKTPPDRESPHQYTAAWTFLQSIGRVPHGAPVQGYEDIFERLDVVGIDPRRLRAVE